MKRIFFVIIAVCLVGATGLFNPSFAKVASEAGSTQETVSEEQQQSFEDTEFYERMKKNADEAKNLVIARVNGAEITMFSLVRMMNRIAPKYVKKGAEATPELTDQIKKAALDKLILQELAIQQAIEKGITIDDEKVNKVINNIKLSLGSDEAYENYLKGRNVSEEQLKAEIVRGQQREIITGREVYGKVKVPEEKIKEEYEKMKAAGKLKTSDKLIVNEIYMMKGKDDESTRKRAEELLKEVRDNNNEFGKLILDGTFITRRIKVTKDRNPEVYKAIKKMEVGELSDVIKDKDSYHIIKVKEKDFARQLTVEEARGFIENRLRVPEQEARWAEWEKELKKNAKIQILLEEVEKKLKEQAEAGKEE